MYLMCVSLDFCVTFPDRQCFVVNSLTSITIMHVQKEIMSEYDITKISKTKPEPPNSNHFVNFFLRFYSSNTKRLLPHGQKFISQMVNTEE